MALGMVAAMAAIIVIARARPEMPALAAGIGLRDDARQAHASHGCLKPTGLFAVATHDDLSIRSQQAQTLNMITKGAHDMVVFAMHIVSNCPPDRDQLRAWGYGEHPAIGHCQALDIT